MPRPRREKRNELCGRECILVPRAARPSWTEGSWQEEKLALELWRLIIIVIGDCDWLSRSKLFRNSNFVLFSKICSTRSLLIFSQWQTTDGFDRPGDLCVCNPVCMENEIKGMKQVKLVSQRRKTSLFNWYRLSLPQRNLKTQHSPVVETSECTPEWGRVSPISDNPFLRN